MESLLEVSHKSNTTAFSRCEVDSAVCVHPHYLGSGGWGGKPELTRTT